MLMEPAKREPLSLHETPGLGPSVLFEVTPPTGEKPDAEIRTSGSEEGATKPINAPYPYPMAFAPCLKTGAPKPGSPGQRHRHDSMRSQYALF